MNYKFKVAKIQAILVDEDVFHTSVNKAYRPQPTLFPIAEPTESRSWQWDVYADVLKGSAVNRIYDDRIRDRLYS